MTATKSDQNRRVIPRWRSSSLSASLGELGALRPRADWIATPDDSERLAARRREWELSPGPTFASDLVGAAFIIGDGSIARDAAKALLETEQSRLRLARSVAVALLGEAQERYQSQDLQEESVSLDAQRATIHVVRKRLWEDPRNSLLWNDLARAYAALGFPEQALKSMDRALMLAPENRLLLRSAARLYVHIDDPQRANDLLRRSDLVKSDPWIIAAEIATASVADRRSLQIGKAKRLLAADSLHPFHLAELASALGTEELEAGSGRAAKRFFRQSLRKPTDNSVAQAEWAREQGAQIPENVPFDVPFSFEARAARDVELGDWISALQQSRLWLTDQPFASEPAAYGSWVASTIQDYEAAEELSAFGMIANPDDIILSNNHIFALANLGRLDEAIREYEQLDKGGASDEERIVLLATGGFLNYRRGDIEGGRALYRAAIAEAKGPRAARLRAMASILMTREEARAKTDEVSRFLTMARDLAQLVNTPDVRLWSEFLDSLRKEARVAELD